MYYVNVNVLPVYFDLEPRGIHLIHVHENRKSSISFALHKGCRGACVVTISLTWQLVIHIESIPGLTAYVPGAFIRDDTRYI